VPSPASERAAGDAGPRRVVVVGGGFAGLAAVKALRGAPLEVILVDRRNHHLFQPLLYQVATGGLSPADIAAPLRHLVARQGNCSVLLGEVVDVLPGERRVVLADGEELAYDALVVATGARPHHFGRDDWERLAPGLKDVEEATRIRARILSAFEQAEREPDAARRDALLRFVVVGGGPTGVELAGALAELARDTLAGDFRRIDPTSARILLVEGGERILPAFPPRLSERAREALERLGVEVRAGTLVTDVRADAVVLGSAAEGSAGAAEELPTRTVLWAAGVRASALGELFARRLEVELDRIGRVVVAADLTVPGHPELFVIGDLAHFAHPAGAEPLPGLAPVAMQQGRHVGRGLLRRLRGEPLLAFRYRDKGLLATIGRASAVAHIGRLRLHGLPAWVLWLFVHLLYLVGFANKLLVLLQWAWNYVTRNRTARLITDVLPEDPPPAPGPPRAPSTRSPAERDPAAE
jgi:NADH dehydrogenase